MALAYRHILQVDKPNEPDRPARSWKYYYMAGAVDFGSNISVGVGKTPDTKVGYNIHPKLHFSNRDQTVLGFLDEFCEIHGIEPQHRETKTSFRLELNRRDDIHHLLRLVRPHLIARHEEAELLLKHILPGLEMGKASSREGFLELMEYVDQIRIRDDVKYDEAYFREEWELRT